MTNQNMIESWLLHAYVDGELDAAECANVQKLLTDDETARGLIEAYGCQKDALKQAYDGVLLEALPASLAASLRSSGAWRGRPYLAMAAALALLILGGVGGWFMAHDPAGMQTRTMAERAIVAHELFTAEVKHPVEVPAAEAEHLQAWLSRRVGTDFEIPDLASEGYALLGGRLLSTESGPAGQLMFEDAQKKRITIFVTANPGGKEMALRVEQRGSLLACYWLDGPLAVTVAGEMDHDRMMQLAKVIYDQMES